MELKLLSKLFLPCDILFDTETMSRQFIIWCRMFFTPPPCHYNKRPSLRGKVINKVHIYNIGFCPLLLINNDTSSILPMLQWHRSSHPGYRFPLSGQLLLRQWKHRTLNELHNAGTRSPPPQKETIFFLHLFTAEWCRKLAKFLSTCYINAIYNILTLHMKSHSFLLLLRSHLMPICKKIHCSWMV